MYLRTLNDLEPKEELKHEQDKLKGLSKEFDDLLKFKNLIDFKRCELIAETILKHCTEFSRVKLIYIESLLKNGKTNEAMNFLKNYINDEERCSDDFNYFQALLLYQEMK